MKKVEYVCQWKSKSSKDVWRSVLCVNLRDCRDLHKWNIFRDLNSRIIKRTITEVVVE